MSGYTLPAPSPILQVGFFFLAIVIALALPLFTWRTTRNARWASATTVLVTGWLILTGLLTQWPGFRSFQLPPPFLLTVLSGATVVALLVLGPYGKKALASASLAGLLTFQGFRFPLELLMHRAYTEGLMVPAALFGHLAVARKLLWGSPEPTT